MQEGKIGEAEESGSCCGKRLKTSSKTMTTKGLGIDK